MYVSSGIAPQQIEDAALSNLVPFTSRDDRDFCLPPQRRSGSKRNDRLFVVPLASHADKDLSDVRDLTSAMREELVKLFVATDELEDKQLKILGWKGPKAALKTVKKGVAAFQKK
jgi:inorganic pyrophosphatase